MSDNSLNPGINYIDNSKIHLKFDGSCLKQEKVSFAYKQGQVYIYIVFEINLLSYTVAQDFVRKLFIWIC